MLLVVGLAMCASAWAQSKEFTLDDSGQWVKGRTPAPGSDEAVMANAAALLAGDDPSAAQSVLEEWIRVNDHSESRWRPRAHLLLGDALLAQGDEFAALFEYERQVVQRFPKSEEFVRAIERELRIGIQYAHGLKRKFLGVRVIKTGDIAEETLIRVQERLPGSEVAEQAAIELADFYYRRNDLELASITYDLYTVNYPNGPNLRKAMERLIRVNVAKYKGPEYDGSSLIDAIEETKHFLHRYPADAEKNAFDDRLVRRLQDALADQTLAGARWYIRRGDQTSARFMLRRLVRRRPNSPAAQDALTLLARHGWDGPALTPAGGDTHGAPSHKGAP